MSEVPAIQLDGVSRRFGATVAVDGVSLAIRPGHVHALLGENGAGKSTIVKMLSGLLYPSAGSIRIFGQELSPVSPRTAHRLGVETAFQEMSTVADLTVLDNMLMPYAPVGPLGLVRRGRARAAVTQHLQALGFAVDLDARTGDLDLALRQKIEIARALWRRPRVLLLDEPTSTLAGVDVDWLAGIVARERAAGTTVIFISHRMREVRAFCDSLSILRNGRHVRTATVDQVTDSEVVETIIGRSIEQTFPPRPAAGAQLGRPVFGMRRLAAGPKLSGVSFDLHEGEVLGIAGLQGMGQQDLFLAGFGIRPPAAGELRLDDAPVRLESPSQAIRAGIGLVPEDRKTEGLFLRLNGRENASMPVLGRFTRGGLIDRAAETAAVARAFATVEVDRRALWTSAGAFSGGNQQKIAIARWLVAASRILLLFDPTRGIDVGTKHELYVLMRDFAAAGGAVLLHSTEIPELVNLCDRVLVLYQGGIVAELAGAAITEPAIMRAALGGHPDAGEAA